MEVILGLPELKQQLNLIAPIVSRKTSLPVLSAVLFEFEQDSYQMIASNLYMEYKTVVMSDLQIEGKSRYAIPYHTLNKIINTLKTDKIVFNFEGNFLKISSNDGQSQFKIPLLDAEEFPAMPLDKKPMYCFSIEKHKLIEIFNLTKNIVSTNNYGCLIESKDGVLSFVKTDGRRLLVYRDNDIQVDKDFSFQIVLDDKLQNVISKFGEDCNYIKVKKHENVVVFDAGFQQITVRELALYFPDYKSVIPQEFDFIVKISSNEFVSMINKAMIINSNVVMFAFKDDTLMIHSEDSHSGGSYNETMNITAVKKPESGNNFEIYFNPVFFKTILPKIKSDYLYFKFVSMSNDRPLMIVPEKDDIIYLVMPVSV